MQRRLLAHTRLERAFAFGVAQLRVMSSNKICEALLSALLSVGLCPLSASAADPPQPPANGGSSGSGKSNDSGFGGVSILLGAGASIRLDDHEDFVVREDGLPTPHLFVQNDSPLRATGMLGLGFKFGKWKSQPLSVFASLGLVDNTSPVVDGFVFGLNIGLNNHLGFAVGYGLHKQQELSYGFRRDAIQFVKDEGLQERFPITMEQSKHYDALPLVGKEGSRFYPGCPLAESFNSSIFVGLTFPFTLKPMFLGK